MALPIARTLKWLVLFFLPWSVQAGQVTTSGSNGSGFQEPSFKNKGTGEFQDEQGTVLAFTNYEATADRVSLTSLHKQYASVASAKQKFQLEIKKATRVLEHDSGNEETRKIEWERAVVVMPSTIGKPTRVILWTYVRRFLRNPIGLTSGCTRARKEIETQNARVINRNRGRRALHLRYHAL